MAGIAQRDVVRHRLVITTRATQAADQVVRLQNLHNLLYRPERWVERIGRCGTSSACAGVLLIRLTAGLARDDARLEYFLSCVPAWVPELRTRLGAGRGR